MARAIERAEQARTRTTSDVAGSSSPVRSATSAATSLSPGRKGKGRSPGINTAERRGTAVMISRGLPDPNREAGLADFFRADSLEDVLDLFSAICHHNDVRGTGGLVGWWSVSSCCSAFLFFFDWFIPTVLLSNCCVF